MNTLLILFPLQSEKNADIFHPYLLKVNWDKEKQERMVKEVVDALKMIDHENFEGFYDKWQRNQFYKSVVNEAEYPNASMLLAYLNDWKDAGHAAGGKVYVNGAVLEADCLGVLNNRAGCAVVDVKALQRKSAKALQLKDQDGRLMGVEILDCTAKDLYLWFVENRDPKRIWDENYAKHTPYKKEGPRGEISALTYSKEDVSEFLRMAVGIKGERRMWYWVRKDKKMIVFSNENLASPTFHGNEFDEDNKKELQKIDKEVMRKLRKIADFQ